jgi:hypothetical protein
MKIIKVPVTAEEIALIEEVEDMMDDALDDQIMARPDGYYWRAPDGKQDIGPFDTYELAAADMGSADELAQEPGESLQEAEDELGISDWIDPDTGELAEGQSHPRFEA